MTFKHPLARHAMVWPTAGVKGKPRRVLVIITTLELDAEHKKYKGDKVEVLSTAAKEWLDANPSEAVDFLLMNRAKEWHGDKS